MSLASPSSVSLSTPVDQVRYRHRHHRYLWLYPRRYRYGYDPGAAMFGGAALGLMGAGIAAATAPIIMVTAGGTPITSMAGEAITPDIMAGAGNAASEPTINSPEPESASEGSGMVGSGEA